MLIPGCILPLPAYYGSGSTEEALICVVQASLNLFNVIDGRDGVEAG